MQGVTPQNRHVISVTQHFLNVHWDRAKPLLLGYSGGPDSKALLYALLACGVVPHLAHVDHGWREESAKDAAFLQREAEKLGCPFFTTRLQVEKKENEARIGRYAFFRSLMPSYGALLLAHQADDLAETVLKRILEGAHLPFLGGMTPVSQNEGMTIWRPLLSLQKKELADFISEYNPLQDPANEDDIYLRARMRKYIFPFLNENFGKETVGNLCLLSTRSQEFKEYFEKKTSHCKIHTAPWGIMVDLQPFERVERRYLLQKIAKKRELFLSKEMVEMLLNGLETGERAQYCRGEVAIEQGWLYIKTETN